MSIINPSNNPPRASLVAWYLAEYPRFNAVALAEFIDSHPQHRHALLRAGVAQLLSVASSAPAAFGTEFD